MMKWKQQEENSLQKLFDTAQMTSMTKIKNAITNVQEGIGDRIRQALSKDKAESDDDDSDVEEEKRSVLASFFSRKK